MSGGVALALVPFLPLLFGAGLGAGGGFRTNSRLSNAEKMTIYNRYIVTQMMDKTQKSPKDQDMNDETL